MLSPREARAEEAQMVVPPLDVGDALALPAIQQGRPLLVCGRKGLDRSVRWVHVAEVANIADLLRGGELLLTTGQALASPASDQRTFMEGLVEREVAGLVLELGQHLTEAPAGAVETASRADLPFIVLRREVRFVDITEELQRRLIDRQLFVLGRAEQLDRALTTLVVAGGGISEVVEALADSIGAPVTLRSGHDEILYTTELPGSPTSDHLISTTIPGGSIVASRLVIRWPRSRLGAYERLAAERAASVIALLMAPDHERVVTLRECGGFLNELATGALSSEEADKRASRLGFRSNGRRLLPIAVSIEGRYGELTEGVGGLAMLAWDLRADLDSADQRALLGMKAQERYLLGLVAMPRGRLRTTFANQTATAIHRAVAQRFGSDVEAVVVIGEASASIAHAAKPLRATIDAADPAGEAARRPWHDAAAADLERLLVSLRADKRVAGFVEARLSAVLKHDANSSSPLLPTLLALTGCGGNRSAAARELGIRRQSLYRRVERIEQLLDGSLEDPDMFLELSLALRARRVLSISRDTAE